ncbi:hypothetical protein GGR54DRAFT_647709 [Hypoxylon sp. NC1633]|nr:hypothetical protein GGR54DRAFT_647709 [Hypoxylon sp. NC1633]
MSSGRRPFPVLQRDNTAMSGNWTSPTPHGSNPATSQLSKPHGPPYASTMAIVGGEPTPAVDDPIAAVLLLLFLLSAGAHLAILRINKARRLKFVFSGMLFALCLLRGLSLVARMVWASYPDAVDAVIAASVMTQCGSVLIFVINLFFAQRVLRAYHPRLGWHRGTCAAVWFLIACVLCCLAVAIVATVHSFFTLDRAARRADRAVQLFAGSYLAFLAFLPVPVVALAAATRPRPREHTWHVEKFGAGRWRAKVGLLVFTSLVAALGAGFRVGVNFDARPRAHPAWFHSRACYYCFNFVTDLVVSTAYLLARFDRRFVVPDGARGPGDYSYSPIVPSTNSHSNLVGGAGMGGDGGAGEGKLPLMGTARPASMMRKPGFSSSTTPSASRAPTPPPPASPQMMAMGIPSSSSPPHHYDILTDTSNTAVPNTPAASIMNFSRKKTTSPPPTASSPPPPLPVSQPPPLSPSSTQHQHQAPPKQQTKSGRRRALMMRSVRMRINSEADAYGPDHTSISHPTHTPNPNTHNTHNPNPNPIHNPHPIRSEAAEALLAVPRLLQCGPRASSGSDVRTPAPAHLGPPILPALDLDRELLSATLLAPWALDSWGFETAAGRRRSRGSSSPVPSSSSSLRDGGGLLAGCDGGGGSGRSSVSVGMAGRRKRECESECEYRGREWWE